ncbi:MAG: MFS transporter [Steroidobacterales bacterium]
MTTTVPTSAAHGNFAAMRNPGFRHFVLLSAGAVLADNVEHVITYYAAFRRFHSPTLGGIAVIAHWAPYLLFSIPIGTLTDRFDPRRLIQIGMLLFIGVSLAWGVLILTNTLQVWHAGVLLVLHGIAGVFWSAPSQVLLYDIVGPGKLESAVRLNATVRYLGFLIGPALGSLLLLSSGASLALLTNALIYVPFLLWLCTAPYGPKFRAGGAGSRPSLRGFADVFATLKAVRDNQVLVAMLLLSGGAALMIGNAYQAQMPQFAQDLRHGNAGVTYSLLLAADACGALLGGIALEMRGGMRSKPATAIMLAMLWCTALGGFALSRSYMLAVGCLFAAGFLELSFNSMSQALIQLNAPNETRGRVIGVYSMASLGARTFSGVSVGLIGSLIGVHYSLASSALLLFALLAVLLRVCSRGHLG